VYTACVPMYTHFGRAGTLMNTGDMSSQARCYAGGRSFLYRCRSRQAPQTVAGSRPPTLPARCRTSVCVCVCVCVYVPCMRMFVRKCMHTQALLYINRNTIKPTIYVCKCKYMRVYEDKHRSDNIHKFYHQLIPSDRFADIHIPFSSFSNT
jgi:hypothetical protein